MRVLIAGATGVIGRQLVTRLNKAGHDVTGLARSADRAAAVRELGAEAAVADALDSSAVAKAVYETSPDAVVNMLTAIPRELNPKRFARDFEMTNRLRTEGTRNLVTAAANAGVGKVISQGLAYAYDPAPGLADEDAPLWVSPPSQFVAARDALRELERLTVEAGGLVLRYGHLYGPGSSMDRDGSVTAQLRSGKMPVVGGGTAVHSFTHAEDAADAVLAALDSAATGALNIVDDDPARVSEWVPHVAELLGAKKPGGAPAALARMAVGGWGVAFMTKLRGADNSRAKEAIGWTPRHPSWRTGFRDELTPAAG